MHYYQIFYHWACVKWESKNPIKGRMPRLIYFSCAMCSILIFLFSPLIATLLNRSSNIAMPMSLVVGYLTSSLFLFYATVKRYQDIDKCGFNAFLVFIPGVNNLVVLYLLFLRGTDGYNAYGPDPLSYLKAEQWKLYQKKMLKQSKREARKYESHTKAIYLVRFLGILFIIIGIFLSWLPFVFYIPHMVELLNSWDSFGIMLGRVNSINDYIGVDRFGNLQDIFLLNKLVFFIIGIGISIAGIFITRMSYRHKNSSQQAETSFPQIKLRGGSMHWRSFLVGMLCGLFIGILSISLIGNRYRVEPTYKGLLSIKLDTWTGKTWIYMDGHWKKMENSN